MLIMNLHISKTTYLISILISSLTGCAPRCSAQAKNDNTIIINGITYSQAVNVFRQCGYLIGAATESVVSTVPQKSKNKIPIVFQIDIKDSIGYFHGKYDGRDITPNLWAHSESYAGHYKGGSFQIMDSIAKAFGKPLSYAKK